ncbi:MAG: adenylate cyclase [Halieaceae bacterium]|jgi:adenylate cyclase
MNPSEEDTGLVGDTAGELQNVAELVLDISHQIARAETLDDQLRIIVERITEITGAERGSLFLNDSQSDELYSRVALGGVKREIRFLNTTGIAGWVFTHGEGMIAADAYADERFNQNIDQATGFTTRNIVCAPVTTVRGEVIGVAQTLNKIDGAFSEDDLVLMQAITTQASIVLQGTLFAERMEALRRKEAEFLTVVSEVSSEINLGPLLQMIMTAVTKMLNADRSTLFINDEKTGELFTQIGQGLGAQTIRLPNNVGIAGTVFTTRKSINLPHAYADLRFNPAVDKQTGYFTRSMLCCPVINKDGKTIGVTQVLNKNGGPFTEEDEARLTAFTSQISIGLENASLFENVQQVKNYNESVLESMSNGVITLDDEGIMVTCNRSGLRILQMEAEDILGCSAAKFFTDKAAWLADRLVQVDQSQQPEIVLDAEVKLQGRSVSVNATILPLTDAKGERLGLMVLLEDISSEKRMKSTMSRYMDPAVADQLMGDGGELLGGQSSEATVLFSDIRAFTTLSEELGAQGIVKLLNDYFTVMVDIVTDEGGMLDKFIGDAVMAIFGTPFPHEDDPDRAVKAALRMMEALAEFNLVREQRNLPPIDIGIGLNTGDVVSGNIGSPKRMDYTVIGDGVNLAARLESATKQYGAHILISEFTHAQLKSSYRTRLVDNVVVKGKTKPVGVYELLDYHTEKSFPGMVEALGYFRDGMDNYRAGDWAAARVHFEKTLAVNPADVCSQVYCERCDYLLENVNPENWDGVWVLASK